MTYKEFVGKQDEILKDIPKEFKGFIRQYAWDHGHSYGHHEVLIYVEEMASMIQLPIELYTARITSEDRKEK